MEIEDVENSFYSLLKYLNFQIVDNGYPKEYSQVFDNKSYLIKIYINNILNVAVVIEERNKRDTHKVFSSKLLSFGEASEYIKNELKAEIRKIKIQSLLSNDKDK